MFLESYSDTRLPVIYSVNGLLVISVRYIIFQDILAYDSKSNILFQQLSISINDLVTREHGDSPL